MSAEPLKTLFHPFEAGAISLWRKGERVLFLGAEPGFRLPEGFEARLHLVQGFRPYFRALQASEFFYTAWIRGGPAHIRRLSGRHRRPEEAPRVR